MGIDIGLVVTNVGLDARHPAEVYMNELVHRIAIATMVGDNLTVYLGSSRCLLILKAVYKAINEQHATGNSQHATGV
jgi:hypothetical protein